MTYCVPTILLLFLDFSPSKDTKQGIEDGEPEGDLERFKDNEGKMD